MPPRLAAHCGLLIAAFLLPACERCRPAPLPSLAASGDASAPSPAASTSSGEAGRRHPLAVRRAPDLEALRRARPRVIAIVERARRLAAGKDRADAASLLAATRAEDPLGAGLALEVSRVADLERPRIRERWAEEALRLSVGRPELEAAARRLVRDHGKASSAPPSMGWTSPPSRDTDSRAVCAAIELALRRGEITLGSSGSSPLASLNCGPDVEVELGSSGLSRAAAVRVILRGNGERALAFVTLQTPEGIRTHGPLADVWTPPVYGLVNDFTLDLERVEILGGGAPEVVVRVTERLTLPDLVLNEIVALDQTRIVVITLDRTGIQTSRGLVLARRVERAPIEPGATPLPGLPRAPASSGPAAFRMKVRWSNNQIELRRESGELVPPFEGQLTLFD